MRLLTYNKFKVGNGDWTDIVTSVVSNVNVSTTTYVSTFEVGSGNSKTSVGFNVTATIYQGNATVTYGSLTLNVPAGALKFTVDMSGWPFKVPENRLALALTMESKGKNGTDNKPKKKPKGSVGTNATVANIDRVDMGDSMFMDVPSTVIIDGAEASVLNSSVITSAGDTEFEWVFPPFKTKLHYDPVLGEDTSSSASSSGSTADSSSGDSTTPAVATAAPVSSATKLLFSSLVAGVEAGIVYCLF